MDFIIKHKNIVIVVTVSILAAILINIVLFAWNNAETNYDRSSISLYDCLVTDVKLVNSFEETETRITFRDPNNNLQTLSVIGNETSKYIEGDTFTVYSDDGSHFELSEKGIIGERIDALYYLLGASFIGFIAIMISLVLCRFKGLIVSLLLIMFSLICV